MDDWLEQLVYARAEGRCEYCSLPAWASPATLQVDHVRAQQHGGSTTPDNLALACADCNLKKGTNIRGVDPLTDQDVPLFNPRRHKWREHFTWTGLTIVGRTDVGRATIRLLDLNSKRRLRLRAKVPPGHP